MEIQVFTADTDASRGITADDVAFIASSFDASKDQPVPNVIGHPSNDAPAHGRIEGFRAEGGKLFAKLGGKLDAIKTGIADGSILNRSIMFWHPEHSSNPKPGKLWPKHLGFLGAASPGIPNMPPLAQALAFSAEAEDGIEITGDAADAVILDPPVNATGVIRFSEPVSPAKPKESTVPLMTEEEIVAQNAKLESDRAAFEADKLAFAANAKATRIASTDSAISALVAEGKVLPAHEADLKLAFAELDSDKVIAFSDKVEASPASRILAIMGKGPKLVPIAEGKISPDGSNPAFVAEGDGQAKQDAAVAERNARYGH